MLAPIGSSEEVEAMPMIIGDWERPMAMGQTKFSREGRRV